ncbi:hypothetical protein JCM30760_21300 [Thiomicrorhabdus hydrogeniphila]
MSLQIKSKWTGNLYLISVGFVIGSVLSLLLTVPLIQSEMTRYETITVISSLAMLTIAVVTISFTYWSNKNQRQHWLDDAFIKYESEKLIEFRIALGDALQSYSFFHNELLQPKKYGFLPKEPPVLKRAEVVKNFNELVHLNNLYNQNQHVFRKHGLDKQISCFSLYLDVVKLLPPEDLKYDMFSQTGENCTYLLENWNVIVSSFVLVARSLIDYSDADQLPDIDKLNEDLKKDLEEERLRLLEVIAQRINELTFKLDEVTLHNYSNSSPSLGARIFKFYQHLES